MVLFLLSTENRIKNKEKIKECKCDKERQRCWWNVISKKKKKWIAVLVQLYKLHTRRRCVRTFRWNFSLSLLFLSRIWTTPRLLHSIKYKMVGLLSDAKSFHLSFFGRKYFIADTPLNPSTADVHYLPDRSSLYCSQLHLFLFSFIWVSKVSSAGGVSFCWRMCYVTVFFRVVFQFSITRSTCQWSCWYFSMLLSTFSDNSVVSRVNVAISALSTISMSTCM